MGAIKDIVDLTRDLESRAKDRKDMELIHQIQSLAFTLHSNYADIIERDVLLIQENAELKKKLADAEALVIAIREEQAVAGKLVRNGNRYFMVDDEKQERPYCLTCWDADRKLVSLLLSRNRFGSHIHCHVCKGR